MRKQKVIVLKHLLIDGQKHFGLKFYTNRVLELLVKQLDDVQWSSTYNMWHIPQKRGSLHRIFQHFKGEAWLDLSSLSPQYRNIGENPAKNIDYLRQKPIPKGERPCPKAFFDTLERQRYAYSTAKAYTHHFHLFSNHFRDRALLDINEDDILAYLQQIARSGKSRSYQDQAINAIKFYYETVMGMPNRFYKIERPPKAKKLPKVLPKEDIIKMINKTENIKHRCIISLLYSAGLRRQELLNLKPTDIDSQRMVITVRNAKGNKDRNTLLSNRLLLDLRAYWKAYRPQKFLFEGVKKGKAYAPRSVVNVVKQAAKRANIERHVTPHVLRHSFATHLLEDGVDIRYIQSLLGHNSTKTTEIYTHVAVNIIKKIRNPLDY